MMKVPVIVLSFVLVSLSGCGAGNSVKNAGTVQTEERIDSKESKQKNVPDSGSSVRSISLDDLLGNTNSKSDNKPVYKMSGNSSPWRYYTGPDGTKRQDISGVEWVVLEGGKGKLLTQAMVGQRLRRYVVKGSLDLGGKTIKMPYGSVLDLGRGSLSNGTLVFDDTRVTPVYAISKQTKLNKVKVSGTYYETLVDLWGVTEEPLFPWDTTAPKRVYTVDLKKFGITPGYQKKGSNGHYSDKQYDLMYNNGVGFTNAIQWAYKNGYDGIRFPKNDYCFTPRTVGKDNSPFCAQVLVQDLERFDIDLGGGSYYNILDSSKKSKYYKDGTEAYDQQSYMFWISCCINVQIHNGVLIGDRKLRDYSQSGETYQEQTYGISLSSYCQNIRVHHIDASGFMGDGLTAGQFGDWFKGYDSSYSTPQMTLTGNALPGKYVLKDGRIVKDRINSDNCTITNYLKLDYKYDNGVDVIGRIAKKRRFSVYNNLGYTRLINNYHNVEILTFDDRESTEVPKRIIRTSYLENFSLLPGETGVKIQSWYDEGAKDGGIQHSGTISDLISSNCVIENCSIHDNHRGGISGGCNNMIIRNCRFSKNHSEKNYAGKVIPLFTVGATNYHIDFEDSYAKGLEIYGNSFSRTTESIGRLLIGVLTFSFHDNVSNSGVVIYNNLFSDVFNNRFDSVGLGLADWRHSTNNPILHDYGFVYQMRVICFHDNFVRKNAVPGKHYRTVVFQYDNQTLHQ